MRSCQYAFVVGVTVCSCFIAQIPDVDAGPPVKSEAIAPSPEKAPVPASTLNVTRRWVDKTGEFHRDGGPAIEDEAKGVKEWYQHGLRHRSDGPAVERVDGHREWWQHGQLHRVDGPAIEFGDGCQEWFQHGQRHRTNGAAVICKNGYQEWWAHGKLHRDDGPAAEHPNGAKGWYQFGHRHRDDGPAKISPNGSKEWYKQGQRLGVTLVPASTAQQVKCGPSP